MNLFDKFISQFSEQCILIGNKVICRICYWVTMVVFYRSKFSCCSGRKHYNQDYQMVKHLQLWNQEYCFTAWWFLSCVMEQNLAGRSNALLLNCFIFIFSYFASSYVSGLKRLYFVSRAFFSNYLKLFLSILMPIGK